MECSIHSRCGDNAQSVRVAVAAFDSPPYLLSLQSLQMGDLKNTYLGALWWGYCSGYYVGVRRPETQACFHMSLNYLPYFFFFF